MTDKGKMFSDEHGRNYRKWLADSRATPVGPMFIEAVQYTREIEVHYYVCEGNTNRLYAGTNFQSAQRLMGDRMTALANEEIAEKRRKIRELGALVKISNEGWTNTDRDMTKWALAEMEGAFEEADRKVE